MERWNPSTWSLCPTSGAHLWSAVSCRLARQRMQTKYFAKLYSKHQWMTIRLLSQLSLPRGRTQWLVRLISARDHWSSVVSRLQLILDSRCLGCSGRAARSSALTSPPLSDLSHCQSSSSGLTYLKSPVEFARSAWVANSEAIHRVALTKHENAKGLMAHSIWC